MKNIDLESQQEPRQNPYPTTTYKDFERQIASQRCLNISSWVVIFLHAVFTIINLAVLSNLDCETEQIE